MYIPRKIARNVPAICVVDNDDFKIDSLTENSQQAHRTNVMFVQPQSIDHKFTVEKVSHSGKKAEIFKELKEKLS